MSARVSEVGFVSERPDVLVRLTEQGATAAYATAQEYAPLETGGLMMGRYTAARRVVTIERMMPPPPDSLHGRTDFLRGTSGLAEEIAEIQQRHEELFVVGEWHTHPAASARPSATDAAHMRRFARRGLFGCLSPLLLILGTTLDADAEWSATLYRKARWRRRSTALERAW